MFFILYNFRYFSYFHLLKVAIQVIEFVIFSIYVNHHHPSPPPRRYLGVEEAAHLPTLFVPSERAKNSWEQAGCVPLPPRKAAKTQKALQTLAFLLLRRTLYPLGQ